MPTFNDRTRCSYRIGNGLREHVTRIARSKWYGILLEVSSVPVHVVRLVGVVYQPDRVPLAILQDLKHCCVVGHGPTAVANQYAVPVRSNGTIHSRSNSIVGQIGVSLGCAHKDQTCPVHWSSSTVGMSADRGVQ